MDPPNSNRISRVPLYSGTLSGFASLHVQDYHLLRWGFPARFCSISSCRSLRALQPRLCRDKDGLGCSAFDRLYSRNHFCSLLLWVLRCFSSPRSPYALHSDRVYTRPGCPIRISADLLAFADPRSFSQLITSFFASQSLGIRRLPFFRFISRYFSFGRRHLPLRVSTKSLTSTPS